MKDSGKPARGDYYIRPSSKLLIMNLKTLLLVLLIVIAIVMIYISYNAGILPPALTGVGFILIAILFFRRNV